MQTILDILMIAVITVLVIDISGFVLSIKSLLSKYFNIKNYYALSLKPFDCSLCMIFWEGLIYLYCKDLLSLFNIMLLLLVACCSPIIKSVYYLLYDIMDMVINKIEKYVIK